MISCENIIKYRVVSHIPKFGDASKSSSGDTASPAGDAASPNCGICGTAENIDKQTEIVYNEDDRDVVYHSHLIDYGVLLYFHPYKHPVL